MEQKIYQKEFSIGEMLSESWDVFTKNIKYFLIISLIFYLPANLVVYLMGVITMENTIKGVELSMSTDITLTIVIIVANLIAGVLGALAMFIVTFVTDDYINSRPLRKVILPTQSYKSPISN